jgi:hypothetical protein
MGKESDGVAGGDLTCEEWEPRAKDVEGCYTSHVQPRTTTSIDSRSDDLLLPISPVLCLDKPHGGHQQYRGND